MQRDGLQIETAVEVDGRDDVPLRAKEGDGSHDGSEKEGSGRRGREEQNRDQRRCFKTSLRQMSLDVLMISQQPSTLGSREWMERQLVRPFSTTSRRLTPHLPHPASKLALLDK